MLPCQQPRCVQFLIWFQLFHFPLGAMLVSHWSPIHWFTAQMIVDARPDQSQELGNSAKSPTWTVCVWTKYLGHLPWLFPSHCQGDGLKAEQTGLELALVWNASVTDGSFTCYASMPAFSLKKKDLFYLKERVAGREGDTHRWGETEIFHFRSLELHPGLSTQVGGTQVLRSSSTAFPSIFHRELAPTECLGSETVL